MSTLLVQGDAREIPLADRSVQCAVTSPPYWGLRDYKVVGQIGLEPTLGEYLAVMVGVFREVRRVLRDDGTCWVNMGDGYANDTKWGGKSGGKNYRSAAGGYQGQRVRRGKDCDPKRGAAAPGQPLHHGSSGLKPKDLMMMPHRLAIALQDDGWYVRSDTVWHKPNAMPESVRDRPSRAHEYVFLLAKSQRYFYDRIAGSEACQSSPNDLRRMAEGRARSGGKSLGHEDALCAASRRTKIGTLRSVGDPAQRGLRSIWRISASGCRQKHFATFPIALPLNCIRAGTSERGRCPHCGAPWRRVVDRTYVNPGNRTTNGPRSAERKSIDFGTAGYAQRLESRTITTGWLPTCKCPTHDPVPCVVLDPFGGAGTTAMAAKELGRHCVIVERKWEYLQIAAPRIARHQPRPHRVRRPRRERPEPTLFEVPA